MAFLSWTLVLDFKTTTYLGFIVLISSQKFLSIRTLEVFPIISIAHLKQKSYQLAASSQQSLPNLLCTHKNNARTFGIPTEGSKPPVKCFRWLVSVMLTSLAGSNPVSPNRSLSTSSWLHLRHGTNFSHQSSSYFKQITNGANTRRQPL